jgi:2-polyprenyl-6-methoxyphenol hydroxylase-like FAD-dependent oxidoreductase
MLPHQAQGLGTAIEDAGSLGLLFGDDFFGGLGGTLPKHKEVRKARATKAQDASLRAVRDLGEGISWKTGNERPGKLQLKRFVDMIRSNMSEKTP